VVKKGLLPVFKVIFGLKENGLSSKKTEKSASVARKIKISNQIIDDFIETAEVVEFLIDNNFT
jgi:hypothetical protein